MDLLKQEMFLVKQTFQEPITLNSTLTGISYTVDASIYNQVFNSGNDTFNNLPAQAVYKLSDNLSKRNLNH